MKNPLIEEIKATEAAIRIYKLEIATKKKLLEREINRLGPRELKGMDYSNERTAGGSTAETEMDQLIRIMKQKQELEEQEEALKIKETENNSKRLIIMEQLSGDEIEIFQAVYINGLSYRSTGRELNMSKSVIYQKVKKIDEKIQRITAQYNNLKTEN
jgi:predicted DNA-binding protein (UPF0251 family)